MSQPHMEPHDEHPDELAGEPVEPEHDLDVDAFEEDPEEEDES
jgi:hypothetical protein